MLRYAPFALVLLQGARQACALRYADNQVPVVKDSEVVARLFPDLEDVEVLSPAFQKTATVPKAFSNGTSGPTPQFELEHFLQTLAARNKWMTYHNPTFRSEEGRSLPYVFLSTSSDEPKVSSGLASHANATRSEKVRIWMQGGVHGNEPAGDQALLALLGKFDANATWAASVLDKVDILMLPRYNPDGVAYFQRYLATSFDPNRDHTKMARQQTRDIKKLVMDFAPHVGVDCHEYSSSRGYDATGKTWLPSQDSQFSAMKNLNIHKDIRALSEGLFTNVIASALDARGLRHSPYVVGSLDQDGGVVLEETTGDAKMGDTSVGLSQAVMFLSETRGIGLADQQFQRRVATGLTLVETLVQTAADNAAHVYATIEAARADFISNNQEIVITDYLRPTNISWTFVNAPNGTLVNVPVTFMNSTPAVANLTRSRPEAYVFSRAWHDAADRLRAAGVVVEELRTGFTGRVEAFNITSATLERNKYEGIARTTVATETFNKLVTIPAGGYWVSTRQKNAAHVFNVMEPENIDSYATFNILPVSAGDEYQVYRVME
ncbi:hypothetical protein PspLS_09962 [Pyricularia sp. CBS 133598]|nr:hypothetical protein PspLS_12185 [Pyricularia sp. CBS 133598]TLD19241.1 hypothetical protein PspLS_09962 [Pyricularia sp. CBS 133598]